MKVSYLIFLLQQVERNLIITNKIGGYESTDELPNDVRVNSTCNRGGWGHNREIFREFLKFIKVFGLKKFFSKILYLGDTGPFARTFSEI